MQMQKLLNRSVGVQWWVLLCVVAAGLGLLIAVVYIDRFPLLDTLDELHNWVVQWTYARTGLLGDWFYRQMIPLPQPIYDSFHIPAALMLRVIGDTFWHARLTRLLLSLIALPFIYRSGVMLYGKRPALMACAISVFFLIPTNFVRPDYGVGIMLAVGFYVYLLAEKHDRPVLHYLTGLLIGLGGEGHPLAYRFGVAFGLIYIAHWVVEMRRRKRFFIDGRTLALGFGGGTAILIYLLVHILPGWEQGTHFATSYAPAARTVGEQIQAGIDILMRQVEVWVESNPIEFLLFVPGLIFAIFRRQKGDRLILFILAVSEVLMLVTYGYYRAFYQVHFLPLFALLMGKVLADGIDNKAQPRAANGGPLHQLVLAGTVLAICAGALFLRASNSADPQRNEFEAIGRQLAATLPPNLKVVGNEDYFVAWRNPNYYGISTTTTPSWFLVTLQDYPLWVATAPDAFIITPELDISKYVPLDSIYSYMQAQGFTYARCFTATGLIHAHLYLRTLPAGWEPQYGCNESVEAVAPRR